MRARRCSRRGRLSMSSRWISISASACGRASLILAVDRLDQRALAHAAGAPEQGVVGRPAPPRSARCWRAGCRAPDRCRPAGRAARRRPARPGAAAALCASHTNASARVEVRLGGERRREALDRSDQAQQQTSKIWSHRTDGASLGLCRGRLGSEGRSIKLPAAASDRRRRHTAGLPASGSCGSAELVPEMCGGRALDVPRGRPQARHHA